MKHLLLLLPLLGVYSVSVPSASAQNLPPPPDCVAPFNGSVAGHFPNTANGFDNRTAGCVTWTLQYQSIGFTGITIAFQSSTGALAPTSFGNYTGSVVEQSASFGTSTTGGIATYSNLVTGTVVATPWVSVNVSGLMGTGTFWGVLYGYKTGYTGGTGGGGGSGGSGCPNPCPVEGVTAAGSAPSTPPVLGAGSDGTDVRTIKTDASGDIVTTALSRTTALSGQQGVTGTAASLGTHVVGGGFCVVADIGNTITVFVGPTGTTTSTGFPLVAGQSACNNLGNTNELFVVASTTGAMVEWFGTN